MLRKPCRLQTDGQTVGRTDGLTDGRTDGQGESSIPPLQLCWAGKQKNPIWPPGGHFESSVAEN